MPGGWEEWSWDETLFAGAAPHYVPGRLPYAAGLADAMRDALDLDGTGRLLDVGCGPGVIALRVAHLFEEVVGVDADPDMLTEVYVRDGRLLERTIDNVVHERFSSSSTAPHLFGDRITEFEADLRQLLAATSPAGVFSVRPPDNTLDIWRLP